MVQLYAIQGEMTRHVKIGRTTDLQSRVAALRTMSPDILHVIGTDTRGMCEGEIHTALSQYRLHGEWFTYHVGDMITLEGFSSLVDKLLTQTHNVGQGRPATHNVGQGRRLSVNVFDMSRYIRY